MFKIKALVFALVLLMSHSAYAIDVATCGASEGYSYRAFRGMHDEKSIGWEKDGISTGQFTLVIDKDGNLDLLISGLLGVASSVGDGAKIIPATISDEAVTVVLLYPNRLVETYVFQKLKNGKVQAMWTATNAETPLPKIAGFVSECKFLNLEALTKKD